MLNLLFAGFMLKIVGGLELIILNVCLILEMHRLIAHLIS